MFPQYIQPVEEFDEVHCKDIQDMPVQDCINELVSYFNANTSDADLIVSFSLVVEFVCQISCRVEVLVENVLGDLHDRYESKFMRGVYDALMDGAKVFKSKKILPLRYIIYILTYNIGPGFKNIAAELRKKKSKVAGSS